MGAHLMDWSPLQRLASTPILGFVVPYLVMLAAVEGLRRVAVRRLDPTVNLPVPRVPADPDPYELAYLRGGAHEVTRLALFALLANGHVRVADRKSWLFERVLPDPPGPRGDAERAVLFALREPRNLRAILARAQATKGSDAAHRLANQLRQDAACHARDRLLRDGRVTAACCLIFALGAVGILALAWLQSATTGVWVWAEIVLGSFVLLWRCQPPRLSARGRAFMRHLRLAFSGLERRASSPAQGGPSRECLLLIALFGFAALAGTAFAPYATLFPRAASAATAGTAIAVGGCGGGGGACGCESGDGCGCG